MSKAILKSIRPRHICNIFNGNKIIEIDKGAPKEWKDYLSGKTTEKPKPREVLIYCTKDRNNKLYRNLGNGKYLLLGPYAPDGFNGLILGKFTLNKMEEIKPTDIYETFSTNPFDTQIQETCEWCKKSCLTFSELDNYLNGNKGYAWHIDNLVIFDKPKELSEFRHLVKYHCENCPYNHEDMDGDICSRCEELKPLTKAPQSWQFIEV